MSTTTQALRAVYSTIPAESKKTARAIKKDDVRKAIRLARDAKKRVRVYSAEGFVPNSYKYRCMIQYVEIDVATKLVFTGWTGAQRPRGAAAIVVVQ